MAVCYKINYFLYSWKLFTIIIYSPRTLSYQVLSTISSYVYPYLMLKISWPYAMVWLTHRYNPFKLFTHFVTCATYLEVSGVIEANFTLRSCDPIFLLLQRLMLNFICSFIYMCLKDDNCNWQWYILFIESKTRLNLKIIIVIHFSILYSYSFSSLLFEENLWHLINDTSIYVCIYVYTYIYILFAASVDLETMIIYQYIRDIFVMNSDFCKQILNSTFNATYLPSPSVPFFIS